MSSESSPNTPIHPRDLTQSDRDALAAITSPTTLRILVAAPHCSVGKTSLAELSDSLAMPISHVSGRIGALYESGLVEKHSYQESHRPIESERAGAVLVPLSRSMLDDKTVQFRTMLRRLCVTIDPETHTWDNEPPLKLQEVGQHRRNVSAFFQPHAWLRLCTLLFLGQKPNATVQTLAKHIRPLKELVPWRCHSMDDIEKRIAAVLSELRQRELAIHNNTKRPHTHQLHLRGTGALTRTWMKIHNLWNGAEEG